MNKTVNVNIGGMAFIIDEDAFNRLHQYLENLKRHFGSTEGGTEIIQDIEARIAELLSEKLATRTIISNRDVEEVIAEMGGPEEFGGTDEPAAPKSANNFESEEPKRVYRHPDDQVLGGVCSGIAAYLGFDPLWLRLAFALAVLFFGTGILIYIILWIVIPKAN